MQTQLPGRRRQGTNTALIISYKRWETYRHSSQVGEDKGTNTALILSYKRWETCRHSSQVGGDKVQTLH